MATFATEKPETSPSAVPAAVPNPDVPEPTKTTEVFAPSPAEAERVSTTDAPKEVEADTFSESPVKPKPGVTSTTEVIVPAAEPTPGPTTEPTHIINPITETVKAPKFFESPAAPKPGATPIAEMVIPVAESGPTTEATTF